MNILVNKTAGAFKQRGSLVVELAVAVLLVAAMSMNIARYHQQTVINQREALLRLQALRALSSFLETAVEQGLASDGQLEVGRNTLSWHVEQWQPCFEPSLPEPPALTVTVRVTYEVRHIKRSITICTVLPHKKGSPYLNF